MSGLSSVDDLMSSDDSEDDNYNYITDLDNINWNQNHAIPPEDKGFVRPAVAVKTKSNRNDGLFKDIMASNKDKSKDVSNIGSEKNKRDFEDNEDIEELNDISVNKDLKSDEKCVKNKKRKINSNESEICFQYSFEDHLNRKKEFNEKSIKNKSQTKSALNSVINDRLFGKAFSPTVYSPEVPVMKPQVLKVKSGQRRSMTLNEDSISDSKFGPKAILAVILDWNTKWLTECTPTEVPPPLSPFGDGIGIKNCYESLEEYQSSYIPLILFETWAQIYEDFNKLNNQNQFVAHLAPEYSSDDCFITITFHTIVPKSKVKAPEMASEGNLVLIELFIDCNTNDTKKVVVFGYVTDSSVDKINSNTTLPKGMTKPNTNSVLMRFTVVMSKRSIRIRSGEQIIVRSFHYLKPTLRQIELISGLNTCPLFKDILKPRSFTCQVVVPTNISLNTPNFNESQNRAILGSFEALSRPYAVPKLLLIQGPPGTGKTHTLIGIIKQLYMKWETPERLPRVLICAPSNGAVDEIARRLYRERRFLQKHECKRPLRCVRVGQSSVIHPDVRQISLDSLVTENSGNDEKRFKTQKQKKTDELEKRLIQLDQDVTDHRVANRKVEHIEAENEMLKVIAELETHQKSKPSECNRNRLKIDIIMKADIVFATLNSSHQQSIENLFRNFGSKTFDCVIVDEASQCSEPELLMPLAYNMTKMILIGDPMQLPATVISKKASSLQFGRSLFERFFHYFRELDANDSKQKNPILMLTEQYRMHPQICQFPSQHFYDGRLTSSPKVIHNRDFALKPYIVFDVTDTQENRRDPTNKYNELEAIFVIKILDIIDQILGSATESGHRVSVGVITPYNGQKNFLNKHIGNKMFKLNVEVNTVDGFQGQERDVIILSCVRAFDTQTPNLSKSIGFLNSIQRMNVSLTRAKYAMIVCISGHSLQNDVNWKALMDNAMKRTNCRFKVPSTLSDDTLKKMLRKIELIDVCD